MCMCGIHCEFWTGVNGGIGIRVRVIGSPSKNSFGSLASNPSSWLFVPIPSSLSKNWRSPVYVMLLGVRYSMSLSFWMFVLFH